MLRQTRHLERPHQVIPVRDRTRRRQGLEDVLADRQRLVQRGIRTDQCHRADATRQARHPRTRRRSDNAASLRLFEARKDQEQGASTAARRIQDRAQRARPETHVHVRQEDRARRVIRVGQAQASDQDLASAALRRKRAA